MLFRSRIGTAPFLHRRPEYRHLEQRSLLAQQRVPSCPVQYGIGRRESRYDSPYMRSLDLGGGRYPLLRDEAVIDGSEPQQLHLVAFLQVLDDIPLITIQYVQYVTLRERRLLGDLVGRILCGQGTEILGNRLVHLLLRIRLGDKKLSCLKCLWHSLIIKD